MIKVYCVYVNVFPVSPSVIDAIATLVTPNENRALHSITVTCTITPDSAADMCEVIATANGLTTLTGNIVTCVVATYVCIYVLEQYN